MDIIITYVDGLDSEWQADYAKCIGEKALTKRYRDWGTLPYLLRGVEKCMPFIEKVFLVVARESQIPKWVDRNTVRIILHKDFIPTEYLPTFNSTAIEMFMHRIKDLSEEFIYFNDDFFPLLPCQPTDFFRNGKTAASMEHHLCTFGNLFRLQTKQSDRLARRAAGFKKSFFYIRPQHTCAPMLKCVCQSLYESHHADILASVTPLREPCNYNQYLYTDYAYFTGKTFHQRISNRHLSMALATPKNITKAIVNPDRKIICINDVEMSEEKFERLYNAMHKAFQTRFPHKSRFEI